MPSNRVVHIRTASDGVAAQSLREGMARIQSELNVSPEFPAEVESAAQAAAASPRLPDLDRTDIPFVTIDPVQPRFLRWSSRAFACSGLTSAMMSGTSSSMRCVFTLEKT